ncbi:Sulfate adenylyltransferase / Adenylylsulfate kinase [hydrothermal vent metagenome]|uniref:Sulfate adenylyltransferase / Adenylylsulfate kinase n=1 Tax=hydrothermal vent metagenome TaxID=652676 RepID=A0A3B0X5R6_9ZZZZ
MDHLISPYKGKLVNLLLDDINAERIKVESESYPAITLTQRQQCDLELLITGALSPLSGFMNQIEYESVLHNTSLPNGTLWPLPYYLDITEEQSEAINIGDKIALRDIEGFMPAILTVESMWRPDKNLEAEQIYSTLDEMHPGVEYLMNAVGNIYVGGRVDAVQTPFHYDFDTLRFTPYELRQHFKKLGWRSIVAFHTSKPMHAVHYEMTMRAAKQAGAHILLHPVVGMSKPGDLHYYSRVHCYEAVLQQYPKSLVELALIPLAMRMAGPREALMNALIRQNYGCSHYIVGPEHAGPPNVRDSGKRFYPTGSSQQYLEKYKDKIDMEIITIDELCYDENKKQFIARKTTKQSLCSSESFSNRRILNSLLKQEEIPQWVSYPEVINALCKSYPPRSKQGLTLFFTGFSGSGKSTLARIIHAKFIEEGERPVTLLDGDVVRLNLSSELGFSRQDRNTNVRRIGYVASEITKNRGVAICAPIAPYKDIRSEVRAKIEEYGSFIEIHVSTPIEECETRDRKGLYAKARKGIIPEFTGISDPYDIPENPEIRVDTTGVSPMLTAQDIYLYLIREGYIGQ